MSVFAGNQRFPRPMLAEEVESRHTGVLFLEDRGDIGIGMAGEPEIGFCCLLWAGRMESEVWWPA